MYLILDIDLKMHVKILRHVKSRISANEILIEECKKYITSRSGENEGKQSKIIEISSLDEIKDKNFEYGYYLFLLDDVVHIYQKKLTTVPGMIYGKYVNDIWEHKRIFQIANYDHIDNVLSRNIELEMTKTVPSVPKLMLSPIRVNLMNELISSQKFKHFKQKFD